MKHALSTVLLAAAMAVATPASAGIQVGLGPVDEVDGESTWLATLAWLTEGEHPWEFLVGHIAERDTAIIRTPDVFWISASKRLTWKRWYVTSGIAYADVDNEVLSNHFQFQTGLGYDFGRVSVSLRHLSNANTGGRNRGETFVLVDYAF
jgi:hypothetical protein